MAERYLRLDPDKLRETLDRLRERLRERCPAADLGEVAAALGRVAEGAAARLAAIRRPSLLLRAVSVVLAAAILGLPIWVWQQWRVRDDGDIRWSGLVRGV